MSAPERISSRDNQQLKFARRVRDGYDRGYIFIEGRRLCDEALGSNLDIECTFVTEEFLSSEKIGNPGQTYLLTEQLFKSIADTANPQGVIIIAKRPRQLQLESLFSDRTIGSALPIWVFLERINNPSNLGAVMRTAEAAGARGVIVSKDSADPFSAKSVRASMGSAFRLPIVNGADLLKTSQLANGIGIYIVALALTGKALHTEFDWSQPSLLVFGSEAAGLPDETVNAIGNSVRISMETSVESLNLGVACGIVLFEARRQMSLSNR